MHTYQPLYLKYRPQTLADLVGQSSVERTLANAIENDRISHAYLFTGPRGTGKTSSARILAKSLNCQTGSTATPCLTCSSCVEVKAGNSPSVFEIDAASNNSVDDARAIIERAPLVAQGGRYKLYIIDECHMLTKEAFNALLKTIEEPPPMVVFILATTEEHKVPPTITSRCQRLMFKLVTQRDLSSHLRKIADIENINIDSEALEMIARRSGGGLRDALGLLDQASLLSTPDKPVGVNDLLLLLGAVHEDALIEISGGVHQRDGYSVLTTVNALLAEGREPAVLILELAKHFLNLTKASYVNDTAGSVTSEALASIVLGSGKYLQALTVQAKLFDRSELAQMVEYLDKLEQTCRRSSQPNLTIEMGLLALCHRHDITFMKELDQRLAVIEEVLGDEIERGPARGPGAKPAVGAARIAAPVPQFSARQSAPAPHVANTAPHVANQAPHVANPAPYAVNPAPHSTASPQAATSPLETAQSQSAPHPQADEEPQTAIPAPRPPVAGASQSLPQPAAAVALEATEADEPIADEVSSILLHEESPESLTAASDSGTAPANSSPSSTDSDSPATPSPESTPRQDSSFDLDEFWSDVKDALQKRHIPTFSVVSVHAFPISFDPGNDSFVLGVKPELQKTLEGKLNHVKAACETVLDRTINVRLKVVSDSPGNSSSKPPPPKSPSGSTPGLSPLPPLPPKLPQGSSPIGAATANKTASQANQPETLAQPRGREPASRPLPAAEDDAEEDESRGGSNGSPDKTGRPVASNPVQSDNREIDPGLIHEAYKLFQGPGSRLII